MTDDSTLALDSPAWHERPTGPGFWLWVEDGEPTVSRLEQFTVDEAWRWAGVSVYGPIPREGESRMMTATRKMIFANHAGRSGEELDDDLVSELDEAAIPHHPFPESMRGVVGVGEEIGTVIVGVLFRWKFLRYCRHWLARGPGLPLDVAQRLHDGHGTQCRVDGHCGCPSPVEMFHGLGVGSYHVDTQAGLNALAAAIREVVERSKTESENHE